MSSTLQNLRNNCRGPVIDGVELSDQPLRYFQTSNFNKVPLIIGTNLNEASSLLCPLNIDTPAKFQQVVSQIFGNHSGETLAIYNLTNYPSPQQAANDIGSDYEFKCPTRSTAR